MVATSHMWLFTLTLKLILNNKELLLMSVISIDIYCIRNENQETLKNVFVHFKRTIENSRHVDIFL